MVSSKRHSIDQNASLSESHPINVFICSLAMLGFGNVAVLLTSLLHGWKDLLPCLLPLL